MCTVHLKIKAFLLIRFGEKEIESKILDVFSDGSHLHSDDGL